MAPPMPGKPRIALWFGQGLENALAARAMLGQIQSERPGADWVLFGPISSLFLFEMDARVPACIPLISLTGKRPAQPRLSYFLEKRAQFKRLRGLQLAECVGVSVQHHNPALNIETAKQFKHLQKQLGTTGTLIQKTWPEYMALEKPLLQAGPQALAFATQLHRATPPNASKVLVVLYSPSVSAEELQQQWAGLATCIPKEKNSRLTVAAVTSGDRLLARHLNKTHPDWLQVDMAQAMGLIAYADRVVSLAPAITRICAEMGRTNQLLLVKTDS